MIEAAMIWNDLNNKSHWDLTVDPAGIEFVEMVALVGQAISSARSLLPRAGRAFEIPQLFAAYV